MDSPDCVFRYLPGCVFRDSPECLFSERVALLALGLLILDEYDRRTVRARGKFRETLSTSPPQNQKGPPRCTLSTPTKTAATPPFTPPCLGDTLGKASPCSHAATGRSPG